MGSLRRAIYFGVSVFVCALAGLALQRIVPAQVITDGRGAVGSVIGVLATLLALVLGLLIWTSYGVFSTQQTETQSLGVATLQLDDLLARYGPETARGRLGVRDTVEQSRQRYFSNKTPNTELAFAVAREKMHDIEAFFAGLHPADEERKQLLANAKRLATSIVDTQLLMSRQLVNPIPELLLTMVQIWSSLLFLGFGVMGNVSAISILADAAGAFALSSAVFLIIEFSEPYSGLFRISSAGIAKVIAELAANAPTV